MLFGKRIGTSEQLSTRMEVSKGPDAQYVGGVQLGLEELAARISQHGQLQQACGRQQELHILLRDVHLAAVHEVHGQPQGCRLDACKCKQRIQWDAKPTTDRDSDGSGGQQWFTLIHVRSADPNVIKSHMLMLNVKFYCIYSAGSTGKRSTR